VNVGVIGAGLAGLAAACELADLGHRVTVYERRPWAGGKTYSFVDRETGCEIDNGQHVFMACTTSYTSFLRRLGTLGLTRRQRRLHVPVLDADGRRSHLAASALPAPLHLAPSFLRYAHLGLAEKARIAKLLASVALSSGANGAGLEHESFAGWLRIRGQPEGTIAGFWDFLVLPTLNARAGEVSAAAALFVLKEGFLASPTSAAIGIPAVPLSRLHVDPAVRYVEARGGEVRPGCGVERVCVEAGRVTALLLRDGSRAQHEAYVCAVPHTRLPQLLPAGVTDRAPLAALAEIPVSPIVNLHLWFDRPVAEFAFAAFVGCELQWVFNRSRLDLSRAPGEHHLVISLSGAGAYMALDRRALLERFLPQLRRALPASREAELVRTVVVKEPEATFVPAPGVVRPGPVTEFENFLLAGAYTSTGWPATMESAVRSGLTAARALHHRLVVHA
jgi:squalene-associated FAD-dependent desaturase